MDLYIVNISLRNFVLLLRNTGNINIRLDVYLLIKSVQSRVQDTSTNISEEKAKMMKGR